jgi:hypothetical protein
MNLVMEGRMKDLLKNSPDDIPDFICERCANESGILTDYLVICNHCGTIYVRVE